MLIISITWMASCDDEKDPTTTPPPTNTSCRVTSVNTSSTGKYDATNTFTSLSKVTYTYNEAGHRTSSAVTNDYRITTGYKRTSSSNTNYQYDKDGFVIKFSNQSVSVEADASTNSQTNIINYEYDKGRLVKAIHQSTYNGTSKQITNIYEYDADGKLTRYYDESTSAGVSVEYLGSKVAKVTWVDQFGKSTNPYLEYNAAGLLVKSIVTRDTDTDEIRYEYNSDGQITRDERYYNNKPRGAAEYEYDTKQNPENIAYGVRLKGHPIIPSPNAQPNYAHNMIKQKSYAPDDKDQWEFISSSVHTLTYNAAGFPTNAIVKNLDKNGAEVSTGSTTYLYEGCQ